MADLPFEGVDSLTLTDKRRPVPGKPLMHLIRPHIGDPAQRSGISSRINRERTSGTSAQDKSSANTR